MTLRTSTLCAIGFTGALLPGCASDESADRVLLGKTQEPFTLAGIQFGTRCQQEYEGDWAPNEGDVWARCSNFVNRVGALGGSGNFYYNLHGAKDAFQNADTCGWSCGYIDSVDFFYTNTHGAVSSTDAQFLMWDAFKIASTATMRLGASGRQNMVFSSFGCDALKTDSLMWTRWSHTFAGGLVLATSGHGDMWNGNTGSSTDYVNRINNLEAIGTAWLESSWYADNRNTPTAAATGANSVDCSYRLGVTRSNLLGTTPIRDAAIGWFCFVSWN